MGTRELITVQCGHYSNFIGTHLWNLQESSFDYHGSSKEPREIFNDITFREGRTLTGEQTFTPRLIAVDLPGSLKTLRKDGALYQPVSPNKTDLMWQGEVDKHVTESSSKNEFLCQLEQVDSGQLDREKMETQQYDLKSSVEVWSDFLRLHLHPNSLLMVPGFSHDSDGGFDTYPAGLQAWESPKFRDSFESKVHFFVEECDNLQGFHLLVDWDSGFGGLGSSLAQELADEYSSKGLLSFTASPLTQPLDQLPLHRPSLLNNALTLDHLSQCSSLLCPLSLLDNPWKTAQKDYPTVRHFPELNCDLSLAYHSSSVLAAAIDTASLLYRSEQGFGTVSALCSPLTEMGRKVCGMNLALPFSLSANSSLISELDRWSLYKRLHPLTPFCTQEDMGRFSQIIAVRGIPSSYPTCLREDPRYGSCHRHPSHVLALHVSDHFPSSAASTNFCIVGNPLTIKTPFPNILPVEYHQNSKVPVCASFQSESNLRQLFTNLTSELGTMNIKRFPAYSTTCLDDDSWSELTHSLTKLGDCYRTRFSPDIEVSDSD